MQNLDNKVILITGAARRIGAATARLLHHEGANLIIHYHQSQNAAQCLADELCAIRSNSVQLVQGNLRDINDLKIRLRQILAKTGRLDGLINNASAFLPSPITSATEDQWEMLFDVNVKAPFFLSQATAPYLDKTHGSIINIVDIYATRPLYDHPIYCASKAALASLTRSLAVELGPNIRVNGVSPGAIMWPESGQDEVAQQRLISRTPLKQIGDPDDIAKTVLFLMCDANYITGQVLNVDGGRTVVG